jgi:hypothetical protein
MDYLSVSGTIEPGGTWARLIAAYEHVKALQEQGLFVFCCGGTMYVAHEADEEVVFQRSSGRQRQRKNAR